jgi:hypothetical protein
MVPADVVLPQRANEPCSVADLAPVLLLIPGGEQVVAGETPQFQQEFLIPIKRFIFWYSFGTPQLEKQSAGFAV